MPIKPFIQGANILVDTTDTNNVSYSINCGLITTTLSELVKPVYSVSYLMDEYTNSNDYMSGIRINGILHDLPTGYTSSEPIGLLLTDINNILIANYSTEDISVTATIVDSLLTVNLIGSFVTSASIKITAYITQPLWLSSEAYIEYNLVSLPKYMIIPLTEEGIYCITTKGDETIETPILYMKKTICEMSELFSKNNNTDLFMTYFVLNQTIECLDCETACKLFDLIQVQIESTNCC